MIIACKTFIHTISPWTWNCMSAHVYIRIYECNIYVCFTILASGYYNRRGNSSSYIMEMIFFYHRGSMLISLALEVLIACRMDRPCIETSLSPKIQWQVRSKGCTYKHPLYLEVTKFLSTSMESGPTWMWQQWSLMIDKDRTRKIISRSILKSPTAILSLSFSLSLPFLLLFSILPLSLSRTWQESFIFY